MSVFCLAPREDWICDRIAKEWCQDNTQNVSTSPEGADVIWLLAGWCWNQIPVSLLEQKKVVATIHHIVPDKFSQEKIRDFINRDRYVDVYHVPNVKTHEAIRNLTSKRIEVLPYWFDDKKWQPIDKEVACKTLGFIENPFRLGSFQRDTEGGDDKTPKLEKGPDILCDFIEMHKEKFGSSLEIILAGWRREYVKNRLNVAGIRFRLGEKVDLNVLKLLYACLDLYVVSSRYEGGPQAILEAAAMKVPIISTNVGIADTILSKKCIVDLPNCFYLPTQDDVDYAFEKVQNNRLSHLGDVYLQFFKDLI